MSKPKKRTKMRRTTSKCLPRDYKSKRKIVRIIGDPEGRLKTALIQVEYLIDRWKNYGLPPTMNSLQFIRHNLSKALNRDSV